MFWILSISLFRSVQKFRTIIKNTGLNYKLKVFNSLLGWFQWNHPITNKLLNTFTQLKTVKKLGSER